MKLPLLTLLCLVPAFWGMEDDEFLREEETLEDIEDTLPMDRASDITPGDNNVICGKSTTRPINDNDDRALDVLPGERFEFRSTKKTRRCVATFIAGPGCPEIRVSCPFFWVKDFMAHQPQVYCNEDKPTPQFPAVNPREGGKLKLWYEQSPPTQEERKKGVQC